MARYYVNVSYKAERGVGHAHYERSEDPPFARIADARDELWRELELTLGDNPETQKSVYYNVIKAAAARAKPDQMFNMNYNDWLFTHWISTRRVTPT